MGLYAQYIREKTNDKIIETDIGFATYRYIEDNTVYIVDVFVMPEFRKTGHGSGLADQVVLEAKSKGYRKLVVSVVPSSKNSTDSLKVILAYGMKLKSSSNDFIVFEKEI
jgi:predicted GNAT family acetyltransferase